MSRWFRHYAGMMRDDKLVRVAVTCCQPVERVVWIWGAILESAAEIDDDGRFDVDAAEIAYFLRSDAADVDAVLHALEQLGRVSGNRVAKWNDRQFKSDRSADRQKALRDRQKQTGDGEHAAPDAMVNGHSDDRVTAASRHGDAPETETELEAETEKEKVAPSLRSGGAPARRRRKPGMPLPEDWRPTEASRDRARSLGFPETKIDDIAEDLRVWANGKGEIRADWDATFDGFVRRDAKGNRGQGPPRQRVVNGFAAYAIDLANEESDATPRQNNDQAASRTTGGLSAGSRAETSGVLDTRQPDAPGGAYTVVDRH